MRQQERERGGREGLKDDWKRRKGRREVERGVGGKGGEMLPLKKLFYLPVSFANPSLHALVRRFCWFIFPPREKCLFHPNTRFHCKGFFWLKGFLFFIKKKTGEIGGKGHFCKTSSFLKKPQLIYFGFFFPIRNTSAGGFGE